MNVKHESLMTKSEGMNDKEISTWRSMVWTYVKYVPKQSIP